MDGYYLPEGFKPRRENGETMDFKERAEYAVNKFNDGIGDDLTLDQYAELSKLIASEIALAVKEAREDSFVKDEGETLLIEGVRYAKGLFCEFGHHGMEVGTLFKIESREDSVLTIRTLKHDEALAESFSQGAEWMRRLAQDAADSEWRKHPYPEMGDPSHNAELTALRIRAAIRDLPTKRDAASS